MTKGEQSGAKTYIKEQNKNFVKCNESICKIMNVSLFNRLSFRLVVSNLLNKDQDLKKFIPNQFLKISGARINCNQRIFIKNKVFGISYNTDNENLILDCDIAINSKDYSMDQVQDNFNQLFDKWLDFDSLNLIDKIINT